jgi:hypothetical protein
MENTPLTRQATRARIGPWYVMQTRNPSAPGMKFSTLLTLIRKGQITPRTVIRGPTTHQLWRFAGRVKGVSKHFGQCYYCGEQLAPEAATCRGCHRSQELPPNPDSLLENDCIATVAPPVMKSVSEPTKTPAAEDPFKLKSPLARPAVPQPKSNKPPEKPVAEPATEEREDADRQWPPERILSARELAAAFSLQYDPKDESGNGGGRGWKIAIAAVAAMLLIGAAVWFVPGLHDQVMGWVSQTIGSTKSNALSPPTPPAVNSTPTQTAKDWLMAPPHVAPPVNAMDNSSTTPPPSAAPQALASASDATPVPDSSKPISSSDSSLPASVSEQLSAQEMDTKAMHLRADGMDAEARGDFTAATYFYEQIEKLPKDHWPIDIDQRLQAARKMSNASSATH